MFKSENFILTFLMTPKTSPPLAGGDEGEGKAKSFSPPPPLPAVGRCSLPRQRGREIKG
jgi:hypothetical protein